MSFASREPWHVYYSKHSLFIRYSTKVPVQELQSKSCTPTPQKSNAAYADPYYLSKTHSYMYEGTSEATGTSIGESTREDRWPIDASRADKTASTQLRWCPLTDTRALRSVKRSHSRARKHRIQRVVVRVFRNRLGNQRSPCIARKKTVVQEHALDGI